MLWKMRPAGAHETAWDGRDGRGIPVAAGVYFARIEAAGWGDSAIKLALIR